MDAWNGYIHYLYRRGRLCYMDPWEEKLLMLIASSSSCAYPGVKEEQVHRELRELTPL